MMQQASDTTERRRVSNWARECAIHAILVSAVLVALFPRVFISGHAITSAYILYDFAPWKDYGSSDDFPHDYAILTWEFLGQFTGWYAVANRALDAGEWPLWNPYEHTGVPLLANYQSAPLYPPRLLHALINLHLASTIVILMKVWLCGMTAFCYARGIRLGLAASRFLSFAWMLCMYNMTWTYWCEVDVSAWFPLQLLAVEWLLSERYRRGFFLLAMSATLMLLAGHPESAFTMSVGAGIYFLIRLAMSWKRMSKPLLAPVVALGAWGAALAVCAAQILPFIEYLRHSYTLVERAGEASSEHALSTMALINFWVPRYFGMTQRSNDEYWGAWINSNYNTVIYGGIAIWFGVLMLFARGGAARSDLRARAIALAVPAVAALLVVFDHPIVQFLKSIPVIGSMWSIWWFAFPAFALPLIAALGIEHWFSQKRSVRDIVPIVLFSAAVTLICVAVYAIFHRPIHVLDGKGLEQVVQRELIVSVALAVVGLAVVAMSARLPTVAAKLVVAWLVIDLLVAGRGMRPTAPYDRIYPDTELTDWLRAQFPPPRCALGSASSATIPDGVMQYYGIEDYLGYDGIYPKRVKVFRERVKMWNAMEPVFSIAYYLNLPALRLFVPEEARERFQYVTTLNGLEVYKNTRAWPRARLVGAAKVVRDEDAMFAEMNEPGFDPASLVLLEEPFDKPLPETPSPEPGTATFVSRTPNSVTIDATASASCALVLTDQYFPGWNAYVDGVRVPVHSAYYLFRTIRLEPGAHRVEFRYEPVSFRWGLGISVAAMVMGILAAAIAVHRCATMP